MTKRKMLLCVAVLLVVVLFSLNLTLSVGSNQSGAIYYSNPLFLNTVTPKTTSEVNRLTYVETLYNASNRILHLWPCHISQGRDGVIVYSEEGGARYNLTAIEPGASSNPIWQISLSLPMRYCWVADLNGDGYDDLAVVKTDNNLTIYNGVNGILINSTNIGSMIVATVDWDNDNGYEILLVSPPSINRPYIFLNLTFINNVTSLDMDNSTYYLNQSSGFTFAVGGDWDLSSIGTEVVLMDANGGSIYVLRSADWARSKTEMVNVSVITLPGGKLFSNLFDFRSPFFAFYMNNSDIGVFCNNSILWTKSAIAQEIRLFQVGTGVKLLKQSLYYGPVNGTIYDALTGSSEYAKIDIITTSHTTSNDKNSLFFKWSSFGMSQFYLSQTDFSGSQPSARETLINFYFYASNYFNIMDSMVHSSHTVIGNEEQESVQFFTYLRDFNGDGKIELLGLNYVDYTLSALELYSLEPTSLTSTGEFFFNLSNLASYLGNSDLRTLGLGLGSLITGIALASLYYIRTRISLVPSKK